MKKLSQKDQPFKVLSSKMSTRKDHIDITYQQPRCEVFMSAHVKDITQLSPTIKGFTFKVEEKTKGSFK